MHEATPELKGKRFCTAQERAVRLAGMYVLLAGAVPLCMNN